MNYLKVVDCSLAQYNTLRIDAKAHIMLFPLNELGVKEIYQDYADFKKIILGNGSNILLSKTYYGSEFVFISFKHLNEITKNDNEIYAQAGVTLSTLSWFALEQSVKGYAFLEDVPGSIGGAIIMNAGTYKDTIGQLIKKVTYFDMQSGEICTESVKQEDFGRRISKWAIQDALILSANFILFDEQNDEQYEEILNEMLEIKKKRYLKQPRNYPNAGSVFKRPTLNGTDYYVWKLFEEVGLRGYKIGGAMISEKHPGFIVNINNAKPDDILALIKLAKERVKSKLEIDLILEWKVI